MSRAIRPEERGWASLPPEAISKPVYELSCGPQGEPRHRFLCYRIPGWAGKGCCYPGPPGCRRKWALVLDETVNGHVYFREEWLRKHRINPEKCSVIGITGESMEPTLPDGCSILLNHGRKQLRDEAIFVVRTGDGVMVKRAERAEGGTWMLASDHDAWETMPMAADAVAIGEVKWMVREL